MKSEHKALLDEAIGALKLRDVMLNECTFKRPHAPPQDTDEIEVRQLTKSNVSFVVGDWPGGDEEGAQLLQITVSLGVRVAGMQTENPPVYFEIEADFLVEYGIRGEVSRDALKMFAELNSVHNVWPFWRQHVFDIVGRARLPHLDVPLYGGVKWEPEADATSVLPPEDGESRPKSSSRKRTGKARTSGA
jgi:preprotein translocase subunit SecB